MNQEIITQVKQALIQTLKLASASEISDSAKLREDLGLDSMSSLTFILALEDSIQGFTVNPDTLEAKHLMTVGSVAEYIQEQLS